MSTTSQNEAAMETVFEKDMKQNLFELRGLLKENSELSAFPMNDEYLLQFLYFSSFDITTAIEKMKVFLNLLITYSAWFASKPPLELKSMIERNAFCLLDARDKSGRAILVVKFCNLNYNVLPEDNAAIFELLLDYGEMQAETRENGVSIILDMENLPWKLMSWVTPRNIKILIQFINCYPCKDFKMHIVKASFIFDAVLKIVWPLLPANIKEMIKFHYNNWSSLHEYISPENLPIEYGGTGPDINFDYYIKKLYNQNEEIKERLKYRRAVWKDST